MKFREVLRLDAKDIWDALDTGRIDVAMVSCTDPKLAGTTYMIISDDRLAFPMWPAVPILRGELARLHPEIVPLLEDLHDRLTAPVMRQLNRQVNEDHCSPADVATEYWRLSRTFDGLPRAK
jgi:glycine betaine/choline ABC-type transport system substrate-binding protein